MSATWRVQGNRNTPSRESSSANRCCSCGDASPAGVLVLLSLLMLAFAYRRNQGNSMNSGGNGDANGDGMRQLLQVPARHSLFMLRGASGAECSNRDPSRSCLSSQRPVRYPLRNNVRIEYGYPEVLPGPERLSSLCSCAIVPHCRPSCSSGWGTSRSRRMSCTTSRRYRSLL